MYLQNSWEMSTQPCRGVSINNNVLQHTKHTKAFNMCSTRVRAWIKVLKSGDLLAPLLHHLLDPSGNISRLKVQPQPVLPSLVILLLLDGFPTTAFFLLLLLIQAVIYKMSLWPRILRLISAKATENTKAFSSERLA